MPDETSVDFGDDWGGGWDPVGLLMRGSGVQMRHSVTMHEVMAEEYIMGLKRVPTQRQIAFAFTLLEYNIANLQMVFPDHELTDTAAGPLQVGFSDLIISAGQDNPSCSIGVEGFRRPDLGDDLTEPQPVRWRLYEASVEPDGETPFAQGGESVIPIVCHALHEDMSGKVSQLHYVTSNIIV